MMASILLHKHDEIVNVKWLVKAGADTQIIAERKVRAADFSRTVAGSP
jgi:hypothetical protein